MRGTSLVAAILGCSLLVAACGDGATGPSTLIPASHTAFPQLANQGGRTLSPTRLVAIAASNDRFRDSLFRFGDAMLASNWWRQVSAPYAVAAAPGTTRITGQPLAPGTIKLSDAEAYIQSSIASSPALAPNGHTMYLLFLPAGVVVGDSPFCGAHYIYGSAGDAFAFVRRCSSGPDTTMVPLTVLASHEVIEAASDPALDAWILKAPPQPWNASAWWMADYPAPLAENADLCPATRYVEDAFTYSRSYSNAAAATGGDPCVPALDVPYFSTSTPDTWFGASPTAVILSPLVRRRLVAIRTVEERPHS